METNISYALIHPLTVETNFSSLSFTHSLQTFPTLSFNLPLQRRTSTLSFTHSLSKHTTPTLSFTHSLWNTLLLTSYSPFHCENKLLFTLNHALTVETNFSSLSFTHSQWKQIDLTLSFNPSPRLPRLVSLLSAGGPTWRGTGWFLAEKSVLEKLHRGVLWTAVFGNVVKKEETQQTERGDLTVEMSVSYSSKVIQALTIHRVNHTGVETLTPAGSVPGPPSHC